MRRHPSRIQSRTALAALAALLAGACDTPSGPLVGGGNGNDPTLTRVLVTPDGRTVQAGASLQFQAAGVMSDGDTTAVTVAWSATGGTITTGGLFTAGQTAGAFRVIAAAGGVADTAAVNVAVAGPPTLVAVVVTPPSATVAAGGAVQFSAAGLLSTGASQAVAVTWTATGGTVSGTGLYTAGAGAGTFRVVATGPGGLADTSTVTVTPAGGGGSAYTAVAGDDWRSYATKDQLKAKDYFWWFRTEDVYQDVDLVADPVFGQVARIRFRQSDETGWAPKLSAGFAPLDRMWFRYRMRFTPGFTTAAPLPSGYANAYKVSFWLWEGLEGRGQVELSNTTEYVLGFRVGAAGGGYVSYTERQLPGSQPWGHVSTEWSDNEWWEYVIYYEKTGSTSARQHWWKRRLTNGGAVANNPWTYIGIEVTGAPTPRAAEIMLGANKNKNNPSTMYIHWGPWEVVDGTRHPNPWNMPNLQ